MVQARGQQAEFATPIARREPGSTFRWLRQAFEQFADGANQGIGALAAQTLV